MEWLLPAEIAPWMGIFLVIAAGFTAAITSSIGVGGGVLLLALMAISMPPAAVIPVHGMVQLGSNFNRAIMTLQHIDWKLLATFTPGACLGAVLASHFLVQLPISMLQLSIAGFILFLCWGPKIPPIGLGRVGTFIAGAITTFISMFAGATGPLVAAFVKQQHKGNRFLTVANFTACMSIQHLPKAFVFGAAGFVFSEWLGLMLLMIISGAIGNWVGIKVLKTLTDKRFGLLFNLILTLLAFQLIWQAMH
ncbi:sulfite exporter TauE/SafE family protein [Nitrincola alkalisediminis]|nr:sulfite exporter TauE/SafE family protein [Nitrincola alkalisediminis]